MSHQWQKDREPPPACEPLPGLWLYSPDWALGEGTPPWLSPFSHTEPPSFMEISQGTEAWGRIKRPQWEPGTSSVLPQLLSCLVLITAQGGPIAVISIYTDEETEGQGGDKGHPGHRMIIILKRVMNKKSVYFCGIFL